MEITKLMDLDDSTFMGTISQSKDQPIATHTPSQPHRFRLILLSSIVNVLLSSVTWFAWLVRELFSSWSGQVIFRRVFWLSTHLVA